MAAKGNGLFIRHLYFFESVRGDLLEGHVYDKLLCDYVFPLFAK